MGKKCSYVCLRNFSIDPHEKTFSKLRQGSGGSYFINMQQVADKIRIDHAKLRLHLDSEVSSSPAATRHDCNNCIYTLDQESSGAVDNLPVLETSIHADVKQSLVYILRDILLGKTSSHQEKKTHFCISNDMAATLEH